MLRGTLLPVDEADAWRIVWLEAATEFIPDEDSHHLAQAMLNALPETHGITGTDPVSRLASWVLMGARSSYSRLALGDQNADTLGIPNRPPFHAAILTFAAGNFALETVRQTIPGATKLTEILGDRTRRAALRHVTRTTGADLTYTRESSIKPTDAHQAA